MVKLLAKIFIKNPAEYTNPLVRKAYGTLCSVLGICLNVLLFAGKYAAGAISGSIAITADAFNNLSDAGASAISLLGFRLSGKKPDPDHPFGHGRIEYISGLAVAALIIVMGVELLISSVEKIMSPEPVEAGLLPAAILLASILVKLYMFAYNRAVGKKISSSAMAATGTDSLSDSIATAVVLLSMGASWLFKVNIDGWAGAAVAVFILFAGYGVAKDTLSPLLGQAPDPKLVQSIEDIVMSSDAVLGMHDLIVHDYGPGRMMISLHAEVDAAATFSSSTTASTPLSAGSRPRSAATRRYTWIPSRPTTSRFVPSAPLSKKRSAMSRGCAASTISVLSWGRATPTSSSTSLWIPASERHPRSSGVSSAEPSRSACRITSPLSPSIPPLFFEGERIKKHLIGRKDAAGEVFFQSASGYFFFLLCS